MDAQLLIIGAGPAGLTAAQYGARAGLNVLVIEKIGAGGQALTIDVLENYPGNAPQLDAQGNVIAAAKSGYEVAMDMHKQAEAFGASFVYGSVALLNKEENHFALTLQDGKKYYSPAVIIATGCKPRLLDVPGEKEFTGKGVSYCATCDANFFKGKKIFAVGGGDAACDEARYLSRLTDKVVLIHRRDAFRAQKALVKRTMENPNIEVRLNTVIKEIKGDKKVNKVVLCNVLKNEIYEEDADAVFVFTGTVPQLDIFADNSIKPELDESGYVITDNKMSTNIEGLYAAGDIRSGTFRQVITAAADGALAAHNAAEYIENLN